MRLLPMHSFLHTTTYCNDTVKIRWCLWETILTDTFNIKRKNTNWCIMLCFYTFNLIESWGYSYLTNISFVDNLILLYLYPSTSNCFAVCKKTCFRIYIWVILWEHFHYRFYLLKLLVCIYFYFIKMFWLFV